MRETSITFFAELIIRKVYSLKICEILKEKIKIVINVEISKS